MHALDPRTVDIDFKKGPRQRQKIDPAARELDGQIGLRLTRRRFLVVVRAHGPENEHQKSAQDAVFIEAFDRVERMINRLNLGYGGERRACLGWVKTGLEQLDQAAG